MTYLSRDLVDLVPIKVWIITMITTLQRFVYLHFLTLYCSFLLYTNTMVTSTVNSHVNLQYCNFVYLKQSSFFTMPFVEFVMHACYNYNTD